MPLADHPSFIRFWAAATVSDFGTYITTLALQILIVVTLHGTAADVGWVSAARWLPYVLIGLVAGMFVDRWDRRRTLIGTDVVRGLLLLAVGGLGAAGLLSLPTPMLLIATFGLLSLFNDVAYQSFVPHLVPRVLLTEANARLEQSGAVAQTTGPALAGAKAGALRWPKVFAGSTGTRSCARSPSPTTAGSCSPRSWGRSSSSMHQRPGIHPVRPRRDARVCRNRQRRRQPAVHPGR